MKPQGSTLRRLLALLAVLAIVAASCGDDDDTDESGGDTTSTEETSDTADDADDAAADDAEEATDDADTADDAGDDAAAGGVAANAPGGADTEARLRLLAGPPPPQWDPVRSVSRCDAFTIVTVYDKLIREEPDGTLIPGLATEWSSPDSTSFEMTLREGVVFHDGTEFNADAVVAHIERSRSADYSTLVSTLAAIESVEATDSHTVLVTLNEPVAGIMPSVFNGRSGMIVSPAALDSAGDNYGVDNAVGAGPYTYASHTPDESATVDRYADHWDVANVFLAGIDHMGNADEFQVERILDGEVDYAVVRDSDFPLVEEAAGNGIEYLLTPSNQYGEMFIDASVAPYDDIRVRQALNHAIDREAIAEFLLAGAADPAYGPLPPTSPAKGVSENQYPYDPEKAQELLAEAGYADGLSITVAQIELPYYTRYATAMQDMLNEAGFDVEIISVAAPEINKSLYERQELDAAFTATLGQPEDGLTLEIRYGANGATNPSGVSPAGFDDLLAEAFATADAEVRNANYAQAEQLLLDEALAVPIYHNSGLSIFRPEVHNIGRGYTGCEMGNFLTPSIWIESAEG